MSSLLSSFFNPHLNQAEHGGIVKWYPETSAVRIATETIDKRMKGSVVLEVIIDTKKENGLYGPLKDINNC